MRRDKSHGSVHKKILNGLNDKKIKIFKKNIKNLLQNFNEKY